MLLSLLQGGAHSVWDVIFLLLAYAVVIFAMLPVHEFAHAWVAHRLGDPTPRWQGRLTLNPFRHLDLFGTLMILLCGFGYAKPVTVDPRRFSTKRMQTGMALTALAGPVSNLLMALLSLGIFKVICLVTGQEVFEYNGYLAATSEGISYVYLVLVQVFAGINLSLAVFNLLPIPPLDGSRILGLFLPSRWMYKLAMYEQYIKIAVFVLLFTNVLDGPLLFLRGLIGWLLCTPLGMPNYFG